MSLRGRSMYLSLMGMGFEIDEGQLLMWWIRILREGILFRSARVCLLKSLYGHKPYNKIVVNEEMQC
jgi:hypothetical protein